ncbi:transposase-like protein [Flavobacterium nitrogenifigens]|uniref:Transposase-like protein n=2 Tax=Flavobacterium TaxID=237 RepID=A0A7W7N849_9FLAO|nr:MULTISPECIES: transposase [Flavobacterium]MBB4802051.1 transposase-like protein [Flavobacterium nitrogenifigens]MBB6387009.1 transposase-like protein [Flavobacterium notoginsengisoli]
MKAYKKAIMHTLLSMKLARKRYDTAFIEKAVLLSFENDNLAKLDKELGLYRGALSSWRERYQFIDLRGVSGTIELKKLTQEEKKIRRIQKRIERSDLKFQILKNAAPYIRNGNSSIFHYIDMNSKEHPILLICEVLGVDRKSYYNWKNRRVPETNKRKILIQQKIASIFFDAERRYGSERIKVVLQKAGYEISATTIKKYMKELGLQAR